MFGPVQPLTTPHLQTLSDRLSLALGQPVVLAEVQKVGEGANGNSGTHYVGIQNCGPHIGLKASDRIGDGSAKERLVAEVASAVGVPNVSQVVAVQVPEIPALRGHDVNAIVWMESCAKIGTLDAAELQRLKADPRDFLHQYGQWMALGLLLGVRDRHTQNWVWSAENNRLAMIDNEECLCPGVVQDFSPALDLVADRAALKRNGPSVGPGISLATGLQAVQDHFQASRAHISQILGGYGFATGYNSQFMGLTGLQLVSFVFPNLA